MARSTTFRRRVIGSIVMGTTLCLNFEGTLNESLLHQM
jgi:hypothetical protein